MNTEFAAFTQSRLPSVLLSTPSCLDVVVNEAHARRFRRVSIGVAATPEDVANAIEAFKKSPPAEDRACYCEQIETVLALTNRECAFGYVADTLKDDRANWISSLEFILESHEENRRIYNVDGVFARLVVINGERFLVASHAELSNIQVRVENVASSFLPPKRLAAVFLIHGEIVYGPIDSEVLPNPVYREFDAQLSRAIDRLGIDDVIEIKQDFLKSLPHIDGLDYNPVCAFVHSCFRDYNDSKKILRERLLKVRSRLFDAPFLMSHILPTLKDILGLYSPDIPANIPKESGGHMGLSDDFKKKLLPQIETSRLKQRLNDIAFERLLPGFLEVDLGKYVAIFDGNIIGKDADKHSLLASLPKEYNRAHITIYEISREPKPKPITTEKPFQKG